MILGGVVVADWFFYGVVGVFVFALLAVFYWFYTVRLKRENRAVLTTKAFGVREWFAEKEIRKSDVSAGEVKFFQKPYTVNLQFPFVRKFNKIYFYYDKDTGRLIVPEGEVRVTSPEDRNKYINAGLWQKIMSLVGKNKAELTLFLVLAGVLCVVTFGVGVLASPYLLKPSNMTVVTKLVGVFV